MSKLRKKTNCTYCGAAPVHHSFEFISTSMHLLTDKILPGTNNKVMGVLMKIVTPFVLFLQKIAFKIWEKLGAIKYIEDENKVVTERTKYILREAKKRNIPMYVMVFFGKTLEYCKALVPVKKNKKKWIYFESLPVPEYVNESANIWVDDKKTFNKKFTINNLPVVKSDFAYTLKGGYKIFEKLTLPVITKPRFGSRARHTTVNITNKEDFKKAFKRAQDLCPAVIVEEFKQGTLYRATCVGQKLIGIIEFIKPKIEADGFSTVKELLTKHNNNKKFKTLTDVKNDEWFWDAIFHQGLTQESIPKKGQIILLSEHSERPNGGYFIDITDRIPEENIKIIEAGARVSGLSVIGFDIISKDLTKPHNIEPLVFIEGNSLPFIELHHIPFEGQVRDTAKAVWDLWNIKK